MNIQTLLTINDPRNFGLISKDAQNRILVAAKATCNILAFKTRNEAIKNVQGRMTLRNTWTKRGIAVDRCNESATRLEDIEAHIGARDRVAYMERQEVGGKRTARGKNLSIPTEEARGGAKQNPVQKKMYLSRLYKTMQKGKRKKKGGEIYVKGEKGIFKIEGRKPKMIYNQMHKETQTKPTLWLDDATQKVAPNAAKIFETQADKAFKV